MNVKILIGDKEVNVEHNVFSYMLTCHSLQLREWKEKEMNRFVEKLRNGELNRDDAEQHLGWLYDELKKIEGHHIDNALLNQTLQETLMSNKFAK